MDPRRIYLLNINGLACSKAEISSLCLLENENFSYIAWNNYRLKNIKNAAH